MGAPKVKVPGPTPEETALQREQLDLLRSQRDVMSRQLREQNLLLPFLYKSLGFTPKFNDQGEIVEFAQDPEMAKDNEQQRRIQRMMATRSEQAIRGELPINASITSDLGNQERDLQASLAAQLGPGAQASTAGQQAMSDFNAKKAALIEAARKGEIDFFQQNQLAQGAANLGARDRALQQSETLSQLLGGTGMQLGGAAGGMGGILNRMMQARQMQFGANQYNAQHAFNPAAMFGSLGGMALGSFMGPMGASMGSSFGKSLFGY